LFNNKARIIITSKHQNIKTLKQLTKINEINENVLKRMIITEEFKQIKNHKKNNFKKYIKSTKNIIINR
jgi:CTP-dependent riboflavin kinase